MANGQGFETILHESAEISNYSVIAVCIGLFFIACFIASVIYTNWQRIKNYYLYITYVHIELPTVVYSASQAGNDDKKECFICLQDYNEGEVLSVIPSCGHSAHKDCLQVTHMDKYRYRFCPACKFRISLQPPI
ncbi:hypothetical protein MKX01_009279 [Papaver californicum]|nr:hypothetical protein MKX01_009279 [Papaver californicum]